MSPNYRHLKLMSPNFRHLKLMSNFSFQDLLVISAVSSLVTIFTILCWGFCARNVGRCRRSVASSSTAPQVASTPVRDLADSMEMAAFTPISIPGPLMSSPIAAPPAQAQERRKSGRLTKRPDYYSSCPDVSRYWLLFIFVIVYICFGWSDLTNWWLICLFISLSNLPFWQDTFLSVDGLIVACSQYIGRFSQLRRHRPFLGICVSLRPFLGNFFSLLSDRWSL